ncbi:MAG TPA: nitroreductase family deazaflavin-dependent oxidoreductase [Thermoleophilaceae bacterium]|jgi:deazaflavin-dependent oxidoreductase (nitroreductase family)
MNATEVILRAHDAIYQRTDGRFGHHMIGVPCLMLRTTGRRSGQQRTNSLVYARDGDDYLVVASVGGRPQPPAWLFNLRANPDVEIQVGRERKPVRAREVGHSDPDFERLWKLTNDGNHGRYYEYQKKTSREIPVVVLSPR